MKILSIDPGSTESGFVVFDNANSTVVEFGKVKNAEILRMLASKKLSMSNEFGISDVSPYDLVLIEKPDFLSLGSGSTVIEAIFWAGRFNQAFKGSITYGRQYLKKSYKLKNDSEVIAFIKKQYPGIHLTKDSWQAMLLVHAFEDNLIGQEKVKKLQKKKKKKVKDEEIWFGK
jgi:hypothetical protein